TILLAPAGALVLVIGVVSLVCLLALGTLAARAGGASMLVGAARVTLWGAVAMLVTAVVGRLAGTTAG
ncbi:MAG TPA: VIT1/CCC1 transporter family protein, partial [Vicinamibacterales bacterium]|nr:VIT1/CCC1 transporter family protein [Vicinamibacterales bacterium]